MFNPDGKWVPHKIANEGSETSDRESMEEEEQTNLTKNKTFTIE